jgi:low affinity Fe/Cu permease
MFGFGDTWQLVINTGTTIITFLMVFLIQNTQNRDGAAVQIKLDELIRAVQGARNTLLDLEDLDENKLEGIREQFANMAARARNVPESSGDESACAAGDERSEPPDGNSRAF